MIGLISCFVLFILGVYGLIVAPRSGPLFIPIILAVGGFIGIIGNIIEIKKMNVS
ncbi:hypothetical protein [Peribacillus simplex]|uniref:hypothetical protein n=1 Tax=Peribacillus simplex TaxID=1478 RepID=UPI003D299F60